MPTTDFATIGFMAKSQQRPSRYPVRLPDEAKRKLSVLAADSGQKIEDFAGQVLAGAIERLYADYAKRIAKESR